MSAVLLLSGCSGGPVQVSDDPAEPGTAAACAALERVLPSTVEGKSRRDTSPDLPNVAVWGDPPILLRCGVPRPSQYNSTAEVYPINWITWLPVDGVNGEVFFAIGLSVWVRVDVPDAYEPEANVLVELADALATVPTASPATAPTPP